MWCRVSGKAATIPTGSAEKASRPHPARRWYEQPSKLISGFVSSGLGRKKLSSAGAALAAGGALALAGAFQFSGLKERCLSECRHPGAFLLQHYRRGVSGAFRLGRRHGVFCLGCCWALMLVVFAAGVANLWWMAVLGCLMFYEKVGRAGDVVAPIAGAVLLALAVLVLAHPAWLPPLLGG